MIHAYDEDYLYYAQRILGDAMDFAIVTLDIDADRFAELFLVSDVSRQFAKGNPDWVAGHTGCELVRAVLAQVGLPDPETPDAMYLDKSPEYWAGWSIAYYQWTTGKSFDDIFRWNKLSDLIAMYHPYHEMDVSAFVDALDAKQKDAARITRLAWYRKQLGLSQSALSARSGVPLRQIQLFEQRQRDINRVQSETLIQLARALYCRPEELME